MPKSADNQIMKFQLKQAVKLCFSLKSQIKSVVFTDCCGRPDKIFVTAGQIVRWDRQNLFIIAEFVSTHFTVILPGFQMFFRYNRVCVMTGFVIVRFLCRLTRSWFPSFFFSDSYVLSLFCEET